MKKGLLIFDPPHGIDVPGKCSPDGKFEEWRFGRELIRKISPMFHSGDYPFEVMSPYLSHDVEPGLMTRVHTYNSLAKNYQDTVMLSLHVDAFHNPPQWWDGTGFTFLTSRENNMSDQLANRMVKAWEQEMTQERIRYNGPKDVSRDRNLTVLYGNETEHADYHGILIENCFMDSRIDIRKLIDPVWIDRLVKTYYLAILYIFDYLNYYTIIPEITLRHEKA